MLRNVSLFYQRGGQHAPELSLFCLIRGSASAGMSVCENQLVSKFAAKIDFPLGGGSMLRNIHSRQEIYVNC